MLRDLEELLHSVSDERSRDFMAEAVRCYYGGLYRAAVVMAMAAAMDDLRRKLTELVATGVAGIDATVKEAHARIEARFNNQDAFENELIETTRKLEMFSPPEEVKLKLLLKVRHLCAHPSGHQGSAEEARESIASLIDLVLSRQPLMGFAAVNALVEQLKQPNFFPMIADDTRTASAVRIELQPILPASYAALSSKLVESILAEVTHPTQPAPAIYTKLGTVWVSPARENLRAFLRSMLAVGDSARRAVWSKIERLIEREETCEDALLIVAADPAGLHLLDDNPLVRERAVALVRRNVAMPVARRVLRGWREAAVLSALDLTDMLRACEVEFVSHLRSRSAAARAELAWPDLDRLFFEKAVEEAGTNIWARANPAIDAMQSLTTAEAATVPADLRAKYVFNVACYATGISANNSARELPANGLGARADFLPDFEELLNSRPAEARATQTNWDALSKIISASGRSDLLHKMLDLFVGVTDGPEHRSGFELATAMEGHADATVAAKATALAAALRPGRVVAP